MSLTLEDIKKVLEEKFGPIRHEVAQLRNELAETKQFLQEASQKYDEVNSKFNTFEQKQKAIANENVTLKKTVLALEGRIKTLEDHVADLQQYSRRDCMEVRGIPFRKDENTNNIIQEVAKLMNVDIEENDISTSHRLPVSSKFKGKNAIPPLIVKFVRRDDKAKFYRGRKFLQAHNASSLGYAEDSNIFINECLTEKNREIFNLGLKFKKANHFKFIWTSNGKTYIRKDKGTKAILIDSKDTLKKMEIGQNG